MLVLNAISLNQRLLCSASYRHMSELYLHIAVHFDNLSGCQHRCVTHISNKNENTYFFLVQKVICVHDVSSIYRVPLLLEEQGVVDYFRRRLDLPIEKQPRRMLMKWKEMADRLVCLVGNNPSAFACYSDSLYLQRENLQAKPYSLEPTSGHLLFLDKNPCCF